MVNNVYIEDFTVVQFFGSLYFFPRLTLLTFSFIALKLQIPNKDTIII